MFRWLLRRKANPFRLFDPNRPSTGVPEPVDGGVFPDDTLWALVPPEHVRFWFADRPEGWLTGGEFITWLRANRTELQGIRAAEWMDKAQSRHCDCELFLRPPRLPPASAPRYPKLHREE